MSLNHRYIACLLWILASFNTLNALIIDEFSANYNDRFANHNDFIAHDFDLSGIGISNNGHWLTMVSSNVFLSSNHYYPADGHSVTFYAGNDQNGNNLTRTVSYSQRIGTSDLQIGYLDQALSTDYTFYGIAENAITDNNQFIDYYFGTDAYLFGRSPNPNSYPIDQNMAVGRNKIDSWTSEATVTNPDHSTTTDMALLAYYNESNEFNYITNEARLLSGDSGAPMMVKVNEGDNAELKLVGINWFIGNDSNNDPLNGFSYVGNYSSEIKSFISANPVPELSATGIYMALFLMTLGLGSRRISLKSNWLQS